MASGEASQQYDAYTAKALALLGPDVDRTFLFNNWRDCGENHDTAVARLTEMKLRRKTGSSSPSSRSASSSPSKSASHLGEVQAMGSTASSSFERPSAFSTSTSSGFGVVADTSSHAQLPMAVSAAAEDPGVDGAAAGSTDKIQVVGRFRPLSDREYMANADGNAVVFNEDGQSCTVTTEGGHQQSFAFNRMFQPMATQAEVYDLVGPPIIDSIAKGFNGAILAYGQTGSGKTHTMMGPHGARALMGGDFANSELGIIPRALLDLCDFARRSEGTVELCVSYIEIYMERIFDLLSADRKKRMQQKVTEDKLKGLHCEGVTEVRIRTADDALDIMALGNAVRSKASTEMNVDSSRSHAVFVVSVINNADPANRKFSQLYLVDLAGSERVDKTGVEGKQLAEAKTINTSLLMLGRVVNALAYKQRHVPYRDSKLTRLLQNALGGNSKTYVMCMCSPHPANSGETVSSLSFGARASRVKNEATVNVVLDAQQLKKHLLTARAEIAELRRNLDDLMRENYLLRSGLQPPTRNAASSGGYEAAPPAACLPLLPSRPSSASAGVSSDLALAAQASSGSTCQALLTACDMTPEARPAQLVDLVGKRLFARQILPSLICPITKAVMADPVCAADGFTYERSAIQALMQKAGRMPAVSPSTGKYFAGKQLLPNTAIKVLITAQAGLLPPPRVVLSSFHRISVFLLEFIFERLNAKSLARAQAVSSDWLAVSSEPALWQALLKSDERPRFKKLAEDFAEDAEMDDPKAAYMQLEFEQAKSENRIVPKAPSRSLGLHLPISKPRTR
eukprot:TRINITY_DN2412_c0_g1_i1.p1 TRINITY_DN2412_c0_g1~~TRINITY_DN2412_c0_g1_i1.p1  ORF type:complete len:795 (-),score=136.96 TRINITY_DN2412_c0_g1_i1:216-2600(-)